MNPLQYPLLHARHPALALALAVGLLASPPAISADLPGQAPSALARIEADVSARHTHIDHLARDELAALAALATPGLILLDVRQPEEYAISHLQGAVRVDPGADLAQVLAQLGDIPRGARVVAYCSVGVRSSRLAERVKPALIARGAAQVANLRGGIFAWHNEGRPLVDAQGPTAAVHGYDARWGRLLTAPAAVIAPAR